MSSNPAPPGVHSFVWKRLDEAEARVKQLESERKVLERRLARLEGGVPPNELRAHVDHVVKVAVGEAIAALAEPPGSLEPDSRPEAKPEGAAASSGAPKAAESTKEPEPSPLEAAFAAISEDEIPTPEQNQARAERQIPPPAAPSQPRGKRL